MMNPTAKKWFGAVVAAITLTMVTSVAPASAGEKGDKSDDRVSVAKRDSGWNIP